MPSSTQLQLPKEGVWKCSSVLYNYLAQVSVFANAEKC